MQKRYSAFILAGIIGLICIFLLGVRGMYSLNLAFLIFLLPVRKQDEREIQLSRRTFNFSLGIIMIILINIYVISNFTNFGIFLKENWVGLLISGFFIILGSTGLILLNRE